MDENKVLKIEYYEQAEALVSDFLIGKYKHLLHYCVFRGEPSAAYKLIPSALRKENWLKLNFSTGCYLDLDQLNNQLEEDIRSWYQIEAEFNALRMFYLKAERRGLPLPSIERLKTFHNPIDPFSYNSELWIPADMRELAGLAQHYGVPTRLLDWSFDFFVALYFAAVGAANNIINKQNIQDDYMVVWVLHGVDLETTKKINGDNPFPFVLVRPPYANNPNLAAQAGVFTLHETLWHPWRSQKTHLEPVDRTPLDKALQCCIRVNTEPLLYKIHLPVSECFNLLNILEGLDYDAARLFPGYGGVAKFIYEDGLIKNNRPR